MAQRELIQGFILGFIVCTRGEFARIVARRQLRIGLAQTGPIVQAGELTQLQQPGLPVRACGVGEPHRLLAAFHRVLVIPL